MMEDIQTDFAVNATLSTESKKQDAGWNESAILHPGEIISRGHPALLFLL
jgi:hypothetical protein